MRSDGTDSASGGVYPAVLHQRSIEHGVRQSPPLVGFYCVNIAWAAGPSRHSARALLCLDEKNSRGKSSKTLRAPAWMSRLKIGTEGQQISQPVHRAGAKNRPRCDVHWNNEILSTIRLQRQGLLEPYDSPSAKPYPASAKAADHTWHAFAARARVLVVNTKLVPDLAQRPKSVLDLTAAKWKGKVAMAKPQFGTTATQAACLFEVLGPDAAKAYFRGLRDNDVQIVAGNKQVAEGVAQGQFAAGITDTDDAIIEVQAGRPVAIIFPDRDSHTDHPRMGTLFIPNTVALIRGCPHADGARKLVDFLLSSEVEKQLAESQSHQIPLNPEVQAHLPKEIERPKGSCGTVQAMQVDFGKAADLWEETQTFLRNEFGR